MKNDGAPEQEKQQLGRPHIDAEEKDIIHGESAVGWGESA